MLCLLTRADVHMDPFKISTILIYINMIAFHEKARLLFGLACSLVHEGLKTLILVRPSIAQGNLSFCMLSFTIPSLILRLAFQRRL